MRRIERDGGNTYIKMDSNNNDDDGKQLLTLTITQALQPQYVLEQTRGIDGFLSPKTGIFL